MAASAGSSSVAIVLVLCAAYVVASFATGDKVPRGASVAGVDIGGLKSADAVARLDSELADDTTQPIPVVAQDAQATLDPGRGRSDVRRAGDGRRADGQ